MTRSACEAFRAFDLRRALREGTLKVGAEFYNYGWSNCGDEIASKTSKGILASKINPATMKLTHYWMPS